MANVFTAQTLVDGPRNVVVRIEGILDTADMTETTVIDPALLSFIDGATSKLGTKLRIDKISYNIEDSLTVNLFWDATTDVRAAQLLGRGTLDFCSFGGLQNNGGAGVTGKITMTTQGWVAAAILSFTMVLELVKQ